MKKTLALLLCLAMLVTVLSVNVFAADAATITVADATADASGVANVEITFANFTSLKGIDVVVTADEGVEITGVSSDDLKTATLVAGEDYKIADNKQSVHIVGLTTDNTGAVITVATKLTADEAKNITVSSCELAKSGEAKIASGDYTIDAGVINVYVEPKKDPVETTPSVATNVKPEDEENYFIPYGSVYTGTFENPTFIPKNDDGSFDLTVGVQNTYQEFKIPTNNFGTYGVTNRADEQYGTAKQFGNYVKTDDISAKSYGSMLFVGDWDAFLTKTNKTTAETVARLEELYTANKDPKYHFVNVTAGGVTIRVYKVAQNNWLWKNNAGTELEYGVLVKNLSENTGYTVVAYNCDKDGSNIAFATDDTIKSEVYN